MDFKISLDRYLTTEPNDGFHEWSEDVLANKITDAFYNENEKWIDTSDVCNKWLNKLYDKGINSELAARIIERTFSIYKSK